MIRKSILFLVSLILLITSCSEKPSISPRQTILLNGFWQFAMDTSKAGINEKWYAKHFSDSVKLPGTLDENKKGIPNTNISETMRLSREKIYAGMAWYRKEVTIPESWKGQNIRLVMERTKPTQVWIDTTFIGMSDDILTAQYYDLTNQLTPGRHILTIMVNNGDGSVPRGITGSHAWTEHTQSNWNGIIGKFCLEAANAAHIENIQVYPDIEKRNILVKVKIYNHEGSPEMMKVILQANAWNSDVKHKVSPKSFPVELKPGENMVELTYKMGNKFQKWSEFNPALYKLTVTLKVRRSNR